MLSNLNYSPACHTVQQIDERYNRNEAEDLKTAIDYIYELRRKLGELHPGVILHVENMLQRARY